jgi:hypothetical protein
MIVSDGTSSGCFMAGAFSLTAPFQIATDPKERPDGWVVFGSTTTTAAKRDEVASPAMQWQRCGCSHGQTPEGICHSAAGRPKRLERGGVRDCRAP